MAVRTDGMMQLVTEQKLGYLASVAADGTLELLLIAKLRKFNYLAFCMDSDAGVR